MHRSAGSAATGNDKVVLQISCGVSEPQISARSLKPGGVRSVQGQSNIYVGLSSGVVGHRDRFAIQPTVIPPCGTGLGREENIRDRQQDHEDNQDRRDDPSRQSGEGPFGELLQFPETKFDCQYGMFEEIEYEILNFEWLCLIIPAREQGLPVRIQDLCNNVAFRHTEHRHPIKYLQSEKQ